MKRSLPALLAIGYPDVTMPDFYDAFTAYLESLAAPGASEATVHAAFSDSMSNLYIITYLRCLCSLELRTHEDDYYPFVMDTRASVKDFCDSEVDAVSTDADQVQIIALSRAWGLRVHIAYLDASPGKVCTVHVFPEEEGGSAEGGVVSGAPVVSLLYRPGHYDICYPQ